MGRIGRAGSANETVCTPLERQRKNTYTYSTALTRVCHAWFRRDTARRHLSHCLIECRVHIDSSQGPDMGLVESCESPQAGDDEEGTQAVTRPPPLATMLMVSEKNLRNRLHRRHIKLYGTHNVRDIGGYKTGRGKSVRWGEVYRADRLSALAWEEQVITAVFSFQHTSMLPPLTPFTVVGIFIPVGNQDHCGPPPRRRRALRQAFSIDPLNSRVLIVFCPHDTLSLTPGTSHPA